MKDGRKCAAQGCDNTADKALIVVHAGQVARAYCCVEHRDAEESRLVEELLKRAGS